MFPAVIQQKQLTNHDCKEDKGPTRFHDSKFFSLGPLWLRVLSILLVIGWSLSVNAQSGRREPPPPAPPAPKNSPGPIAEPVSAGSRSRATRSDKRESETESGEEVDSSDVLRVSSVLVPIPATVIDASGQVLTSLRREDFELRVDGQLRTIAEISRSETPVRLAMLFDNSGSVDFAREFEKQAAISFFRKVLRPQDQAAIYSVGTRSYLAQPLTNDIGKLEHTISHFRSPWGATSLFSAIIDAASYLSSTPGRKVVVVVSDGVDTTSKVDFQNVLKHVLTSDCQVYTVQTGLYESANVRELAAERRMEELGLKSGGTAYIPRTLSELDAAFVQIAADLAQQYVVNYYPGGEHRDGEFHQIELRVLTRDNVRVRSRTGYYSREQ